MASISAIQAGAAEVGLFLRDKQFMESLKKVERRIKTLRTTMDQLSRSRGIRIPGIDQTIKKLEKLGVRLKVIGDRMKSVGASIRSTGQLLLTGGLATLFGGTVLPVRNFTQFDDLLLNLRAKSAAAADEIQNLKNQSLGLGASTSFSPQQITAGQVGLAQQGLDAGEIEESTGAVLSLARATGQELSESALLATRIIRGFRLEASEMASVADIITATLNNSAQDATELGEALKLASSAASNAGVSFSEVAAATALMADTGVRGSIAGTSLRRILFNLGNPNIRKRFTENMEELGATVPEFQDAEGNFRPLFEVLRDLGTATAGLGSAERTGALESLFGRGTNAALGLISSIDKLEDFEGFLQTVEGQADLVAEVMDSGIGGAIRRLISSIQDLAIRAGEALSPLVEGISGVLKSIVNSTSAFISENAGLVAIIAAIVGGVALVGGALVALGLTVGLIGSAFTVLGGVFASFVAIIGPWIPLVLKAGAALFILEKAGFQVAGTLRSAFNGLISVVSQFVSRMQEGLGTVALALKNGDLPAAFEALTLIAVAEWNRMLIFLEDNFGKWITNLVNAWNSVANFFSAVWYGMGIFMAQVWDNLMAAVGAAFGDTVDESGENMGRLSSNWSAATANMFSSWEGFVQGMWRVFRVAGSAILDLLLEMFQAFSGLANALQIIDSTLGTNLRDKFDKVIDDLQDLNQDGVEFDIKRSQEIQAKNELALQAAADRRRQAAEDRLKNAQIELNSVKFQQQQALAFKEAEKERLAGQIKAFNRSDEKKESDPLDPNQGVGNLEAIGTFNAAVAARLGSGLRPGEEKQINELKDVNANLEDIKEGLDVGVA